MAKFFETFEVIESDGAWVRGPQPVDMPGRGLATALVDACAPADRPTPEDYPLGEDVHPFAIVANDIVPVRCSPEDIIDTDREEVIRATEYHVTKAMWSGVPGVANYDHFLTHPDVTTVPRAAGYAETLANVLKTSFDDRPGIRPVVHLGFLAAQALQLGLNNLGLPYVVAQGYPVDAVAVTGHVRVLLSPLTTLTDVRRDDNRREIEFTRFARIEFDTSTAVRAA